ncbi:membrane protein insertase YidC [Robertmurraya massiliosenegalensis]|uniref:membrane protein insertase YidC n=1 Tax=Robertmurraya TaxID=2837507 RepID=UPI0039A5C9AE
MKNKYKVLIILLLSTVLLSACSAQEGNGEGFFNTFLVSPFESLIHGTANLFGGNFGLSIIFITLIIRLLLMPMMLKQTKKQRAMKIKMDVMKPELEDIQKKLKQTKDAGEQQKLQQEMFALYKKHNINPLAMGCLPILIQMPILLSFYYAIRGSAEIASHSFLWFSLGQPDIWLTAIAGIVYYFQFRVSLSNMPNDQQKQMKFMGILSPVMIVFVSLNAPAALPLYWTIGGIFLILQTLLARYLYKNEENLVITNQQ